MINDSPRERVRVACADGDLRTAQEAMRAFVAADPDAAAVGFAHRRADELAERLSLPVRRLALLASFTAEPLTPHLAARRFLEGERLEVGYWPYGQWYAALTQGSDLDAFDPDWILLLLHLEDVAALLAHRHLAERERLEEERTTFITGLAEALREFRARSSKPIILSTFIAARRGIERFFDRTAEPCRTAWIEQLNDDLASLAAEHSNVYVFDYAGLVTDIGRHNWYDLVKTHVNKASIAGRALPSLAEEFSRFLSALDRGRRKVVAVDLDNSLWGGILGEDGVEGIAVSGEYPGNAYEEFQSFLSNLRASGALLALISKNNLQDAREAFERHSLMPLKWSDFASHRVNWDDKAANLQAAAAEINVGVDSFVFADDNPMECDLVQTYLPEVVTVELDGPPGLFPDKLLATGQLDSPRLTGEDLIRAGSYGSENKRQALRHESSDISGFLASLDLQLALGSPDTGNIERMVQLFSRTNQFNLTAKRYGHHEVSELLADDNVEVTIARLCDRFGDYGVIGLAVLRHGVETTEVDSLLMSCRALGRNVEECVVAFLEERARARGAKHLTGVYSPTAKNGLVADLFTRLGFSADSQGRAFNRNLETEPPLRYPSHIHIEKMERA